MLAFTLALAIVDPSRSAAAQRGGAIDGTLRGASAPSAAVELTRLRPEPIVVLDTRADARGVFRFDSLVPGDYALRVTTPILDSLELALPDRAVTIEAGRRTRVEIQMPSGGALREALCPGLALGKDRGVITGRAIDAVTEQPLAGAAVVVAWNELQMDRATLKASTEERVGRVESDARGEYRLCGVPTGTTLSLQLQLGSASSAVVQVAVSDSEGTLMRDLSLAVDTLAVDTLATAAPSVAAGAPGDSTARPPSRAPALALRTPTTIATASLAGIVRGAAGQPLGAAEVRVEGTDRSTVSDESGRYVLTALPAGTRMLVVRRIGFEVTSVPVDLRAGRSAQRDIQLTRVVSLDSIRIVAMRSRFPEFEYNRRANPFGYYLGPEEIERRKAAETSDLIHGIPGVSVRGHGNDAQAVSVHGRPGAGACAGMRVVVNDWMDGMALNDIPASQVAAIELYPQGAFAPSKYAVRGSCGVLVIWTKESARTPASPPQAAPIH